MRRSEAKEEKDTPSGPESLPLWEGLFTVLTPGTEAFITCEQTRHLSRFTHYHGWGDPERVEGST